MVSQHDDADALLALVDLASRVQSACAGHGDVQDDDVRPEQESLFDDRATIQLSPDDTKISAQQCRYTLGDEAMVFCE
jgi:hypothetical protein